MRRETPFPQGLSQIQAPLPAARQSDEARELPPLPGAHRDLVRTVLAVLFLGGLIAASFWILWPFVPATIWATTLVVATWPIMLRVQRRLWNRRALAVTVMTLALLIVFVAPFWLAFATIAQNFDTLVGWGNTIVTFRVPPPPDWLNDLPLFSSQIIGLWQKVQASGIDELAAKAGPYAGGVAGWLVGALGGLGITIVQLLLTLVIAAILYAGGDRAEVMAERFGHRLAGARGREAVRLAGQATRSVALGVVVTALVQSMMTGAGLAAAGVPLPGVLTAVTFILCIAQLGPGLVLIPAVVWVFWSSHPGWGTALLVWSIIVIGMDNVVRPLLMRKVRLPLVLLLAGVIGGLIAFGLVGVFLGPVVLAVAYTLLQAWLAEDPNPDEAA
ncbi:MAG: AI-2E family transporter YdiK [Alphaproteobacteria bacterium]|nr:AI-2E family transporter YdiK [Alphaproteobacteria bacterium]